MTHSLSDPRVDAILSRMFDEAGLDDTRRGPRTWPESAQERADAMAEIYMPISRDGGRLLYSLVRAARPEIVVEFGMSFGISTLFLAAAVRDNGAGHVFTTELSAAKIAAAKATFGEAGLDDAITVLEGDARETLADLDGAVGFALLDGWKDLCLPVLRVLEPRLRPGTLVVADDVNLVSLEPYLSYVRDPANGYESVTFPVGDGMEISCRV
ncbi:MAG TPA: class I SAM-dependent methyltransferase [Streptosporangiaceae bacterium]|jgi:predicted O-methyltransferase YrrM